MLELRLKAGDSFSVGRRAKSEVLKEIVQMGDGPARLTAEARQACHKLWLMFAKTDA